VILKLKNLIASISGIGLLKSIKNPLPLFYYEFSFYIAASRSVFKVSNLLFKVIFLSRLLIFLEFWPVSSDTSKKTSKNESIVFVEEHFQEDV